LSVPTTTWQETLPKETPKDYARSVLETLYPGTRIKNIRKRKVKADWTVYANVDDKQDRGLGITGNISLDETTLKANDKSLLQLFFNRERFLPNYYLLLKNSLLDIDDVIKNAVDQHKEETLCPDGMAYTTITYIVPVEKIKHAIISSYPSPDWWTRRHTQ